MKTVTQKIQNQNLKSLEQVLPYKCKYIHNLFRKISVW